jgi:predicted RNA-binding protein YlqC (UPF0109 family)
MENLILEMAKSLVDQPAEVSVEAFGNHRSAVYELQVAKQDVGKIIGRKGRTIKAMRTILAAAASRNGQRYVTLEVLE